MAAAAYGGHCRDLLFPFLGELHESRLRDAGRFEAFDTHR